MRRQIAVLTAWVAVCCFVDVTEVKALGVASTSSDWVPHSRLPRLVVTAVILSTPYAGSSEAKRATQG